MQSKLKFKSVETTINRIKKKQYPALPHHLREVEKFFKDDKSIECFGKALTNNNKFYFDTKVGNNFAHQIYGSMATIKFVEENINACARNYVLDGTFQIVPKPFKQVLIISIEHNNNVS